MLPSKLQSLKRELETISVHKGDVTLTILENLERHPDLLAKLSEGKIKSFSVAPGKCPSCGKQL